MKKVSEKIKDWDFFGVNLSFLYLSKEKHGSIFGSFLSIFLLLIIIYKLCMFLSKMITRDDPDFKMQESQLVNDTIQLLNFSIYICPAISEKSSDSESSEFTEISEFFDMYLELSDMNNYTKPLPLKTKQIKSSNEYDYNCLQVYQDNQTSINLTSTNNVFKDLSLYFDLYIDLTNFKNYYKNESDFDDLTSFMIYFDKTYVNTSEYYNYFRSIKNYMFINATEGRSYYIKQNVEKISVEFVDDILTFGLFEPKKTRYDNYTFTGREINTNAYDKDMAHIQIEFKHSKMMKLYIITSFSIENLLSQFVGYIQIMSFIFCYIGESYNHWNLRRNIKFRFKDKLNENYKVYNKLDHLIYKKSKDNSSINENSSEKNRINNSKANQDENINIEMKEIENKNDHSNLPINLKKNKEVVIQTSSNKDLEDLTENF